jgi:F-type H+-transporting ATPase subunit b
MLEGLRSLGFNVPTLLAQVVTFIILLVVLRLVAYKPVMRMLDERARKVNESLEQTEYIKEQAAHAEEKGRRW